MNVTEGALTVVVPIRVGREEALRSLLERIGKDPGNDEQVPFHLIGSLHFARWSILPAGTSATGQPIPAQLAFSSSFDLPREAHFNDFIARTAEGLHEIYGHCRGYPEMRVPCKQVLLGYLLTHAVPEQTLYIGTPGLSASTIRRQQELRDAIGAFLDREGAINEHWRNSSPTAVRKAIQAFVRADESLSWAQEPPPRTPNALGVPGWTGIVLITLLAAPFMLSWWLLIRIKELRRGSQELPEATNAPPDRQGLVQGHLTHVSVIEPGFVRGRTLRFVLWLVHFAGRRIFNQGVLYGVSTLHFVRWVIIDRGQRLLFITNYDGSMTGYVSDFIHRSWEIPSALTAIWTNTLGFPKTSWLIREGARDMPAFTAFLLRQRASTPVWYSAYPYLTSGNIISNSRIRADLFSDLSESETREWLRLF